MRKVWLYQRKNRPGVYVLWYGGDGRQHSRRCPDAKAAEVFKIKLEYKLNIEFYTEAVSLSWEEMRTSYLEEKRSVSRASPGTIISYEGVLNLFEERCGKPYSTKINVALIKQYVKKRTDEGTLAPTINKDLRSLRAFLNWAVESNYAGESAKSIQWNKLFQKEEKKPVRGFPVQQLGKLIATAERLYGTDWRIRLLLGIGTGLRLRDVERLRIEDLNFAEGGVTTRSRKTGKAMGIRPLHSTILAEVQRYTADRTDGPILVDLWSHSKWDRIRDAAGLPDAIHKRLRKSFGSFLAQAGFSISVAMELLEHSDPKLTKDVYQDVDPVLRSAAQAIPIDAILRAAQDQPPETPGPETPARPSGST